MKKKYRIFMNRRMETRDRDERAGRVDGEGEKLLFGR